MKMIKKLTLFCMTLAATVAFSTGCELLMSGGISSPSSSNTSTSSKQESSSKNPNSSSQKPNSSSSQKEESSQGNSSSSSAKPESSIPESSSSSVIENSSSSVVENSSSSVVEDSSSSVVENSSSSVVEDSSSSIIEDSSSSVVEDSSSSILEDSSSSIVDNEYPDTYPNDGNCVFGDWELVREADCDTKGVKVRYCAAHENHADYEMFAAREHDYGVQGVCSVCNEEAPLPTINVNANYINLTAGNTTIVGSGNEYDWFEVSVGGYYEIEIFTNLESKNEVWFQFGVPEPGQYAVISVSNPSCVTATQWNASIAGIYNPQPTRVFNDDNFIGTVHCSKNYSNPNDLENWRATFSLSGKPGDKVKFFIAKIASTTWTPSYINIEKTAENLIGVAPDGEQGTTATDVPYNSEYFYDETNGYYRMGTKTNPGAIIYMAISKNATRLMGEMSFVNLQTAGAGLRYQVGVTVEGDYLSYDFAPMLYSDPFYNGRENSYQNFLNADGMYPVTKELFDFLKVYVKNNTVVTPPPAANADNAWLAACYYYATVKLGSVGNPIAVDKLGTFTAQQYHKLAYVYYTFTYNPNPEATGSAITYCTISVDMDNVSLTMQGKEYRNQNGVKQIQNIAFEASSTSPITFIFKTLNMTTNPIEVTLSLLEGSSEKPIALETLGDVAFTPIEILTLSGEVKYEVYYSYTATETGTLTLNNNSTAQIILGENTNPVDGTASVEVEAGETVSIYISATSSDAVNVNLSFNAN